MIPDGGLSQARLFDIAIALADALSAALLPQTPSDPLDLPHGHAVPHLLDDLLLSIRRQPRKCHGRPTIESSGAILLRFFQN